MIENALIQIFGQGPDHKLQPVSGGDIGDSYKVVISGTPYFCKWYKNTRGRSMATAEKEGLLRLGQTGKIAVPTVIGCELLDDGGLIVLEYIEAVKATASSMRDLGRSISSLHNLQVQQFGAAESNFIGRLEQENTLSSDWPYFFTHYRLMPQYEKAKGNGLLSADEMPNPELVLEVLKTFTKGVAPSLLHGDLWNGNVVFDTSGQPYLIDPSVYCGDGLVDIAMAQLFGCFGQEFFETYKECTPDHPFEKERVDIYQLYYLLVHLNLFGTSYKGSVMKTTTAYFR